MEKVRKTLSENIKNNKVNYSSINSRKFIASMLIINVPLSTVCVFK